MTERRVEAAAKCIDPDAWSAEAEAALDKCTDGHIAYEALWIGPARQKAREKARAAPAAADAAVPKMDEAEALVRKVGRGAHVSWKVEHVRLIDESCFDWGQFTVTVTREDDPAGRSDG